MSNAALTKPWHRLEGLVAPEILQAPKTCADPLANGEWPELDESASGYLERVVAGSPWMNHLTLAALVMTAQRRQANSVLRQGVQTLHPRLSDWFQALELTSMPEFDPTDVFRRYLDGELIPSHSVYQRNEAWKRYTVTSKLMARWLRSLPADVQGLYAPFCIPEPEYAELYWVNKLTSRVQADAEGTRKQETDAVVPGLPYMRAIAQLRLNKVARMRQAYQDALTKVQKHGAAPPFAFSYDEGEDKKEGIPPQERLHFRLWDRRSFVEAHKEHYSEQSRKACEDKAGAYSDEKNRLFLEFVRSEPLIGDAEPEGLWFADLLGRGLLGSGPRWGSEEEVAARQAFLRSWGYGKGDEDESAEDNALVQPFVTGVAGLLTWPKYDSAWMVDAQRVAHGALVPVDAIYAGTMFGLLAVDIFTTTGMRINEAMQIRATPDCFVKLTFPAPEGAKDQKPIDRFCLRLIPKGERENKPHDFFIGPEQVRLIALVKKMLLEHYGSELPSVDFNKTSHRAFRFKEKQPYLFQYSGRHLQPKTIGACIKFVLHGMAYKTRDGQNVVVKSHLLRHAFATHAVQVLGIKEDIVGGWLKQKDLRVTQYYDKPTDSMLAAHHDQLLTRIAAHVDVGKAVLRSPEEQQRAFNEAKGKAGTLAQVEGGWCVSHGFCAAKFACVGCAGKVVDPAKRHQIEAKKQWAEMQIPHFTGEGLLPEAERMKKLVRDCDLELEEMELIEKYRRDGQNVAIVRADDLDIL